MMTDNTKRVQRRSNKGISIVEVVVIVAIIAILGGYIAYNIGVTNGYRARKAKNILASQISELKVRTLSKAIATGDTYMKVYQDGKTVYSAVYYKEGGTTQSEEPVELGSRIGVTFGGSALSETTIGDEASTQLILCFNRSTGALMKYEVTGGTPTITSLSDIEYVKTKVFDKEYVIELVPATGKVVNKTR